MSHFPEDQDENPRDLPEDKPRDDAAGPGENMENGANNDLRDDNSPDNPPAGVPAPPEAKKSITPPPGMVFRQVTGPINIVAPENQTKNISTAEEIVQELTSSSPATPASKPVKYFPEEFFAAPPVDKKIEEDYQKRHEATTSADPMLDEIRHALEKNPSMVYVPKFGQSSSLSATDTESSEVEAETPEIPKEIAAHEETLPFANDIFVHTEEKVAFAPEITDLETEAEGGQEVVQEISRVPNELPVSQRDDKPVLPKRPRRMSGYTGTVEEDLPDGKGVIAYMTRVGAQIENWVCHLGDFAYFVFQVVWWTLRLPRKGTLLPCMYEIGIMSLPVIALTGTFIGMVLSIQSYNQLKDFYLETRMGALINLSLVRELGPVLAATMLSGRIGSSMAAELGTMRVTEQIDAMGGMGVNPIHYLVVPRVLGCIMLIPVLTIVADFMGIVGGAYLSVWVFGVDWHFYLTNSNKIVGAFDIFIGVFKSVFFGAAIGLIGCHRGFNSRAGAQGVGKAATEAFVFSFVIILMLDLALGIILETFNATFISTGPKQI